MNYIKIGNTSFNTDKLGFKTRPEFLEMYKGKFLKKELDQAWSELKHFIKEASKPISPKKEYKKGERE
jgi:hypothetical protein